jgi:hypothetical protein
MLDVGDCDQVRVKENGGGQLKRNAVFVDVRICLGRVPLELN